MVAGRALHFVFKIADRPKNINFFREILGMKLNSSIVWNANSAMTLPNWFTLLKLYVKNIFLGKVFSAYVKQDRAKAFNVVLRHEEFDEGCKAACNGPYGGKWSKTMIGYGSEDNHFVVELTYNYGIRNDFLGFYIQSSEALERAKSAGLPVKEEGDKFLIKSPDGYKFYLTNKPQPGDKGEHLYKKAFCKKFKDPVQKVALASSNLEKSIKYWRDLTGIKVFEKGDKFVSLAFAEDQARLVLKDIGGPVDHAKAYGRIAFSCPSEELKPTEALMKEKGQTILTPYTSLDTPGKKTVEVVILADP
ncbi:Glyoxalase domain-containing protein 4, partial [Armadillidium nasatum]